jgi:hypothetical protein
MGMISLVIRDRYLDHYGRVIAPELHAKPFLDLIRFLLIQEYGFLILLVGNVYLSGIFL